MKEWYEEFITGADTEKFVHCLSGNSKTIYDSDRVMCAYTLASCKAAGFKVDAGDAKNVFDATHKMVFRGYSAYPFYAMLSVFLKGMKKNLM